MVRRDRTQRRCPAIPLVKQKRGVPHVAIWRKLGHSPSLALIPPSYRIQGMADPSNSISIDASP